MMKTTFLELTMQLNDISLQYNPGTDWTYVNTQLYLYLYDRLSYFRVELTENLEST